LTIGGDFPHNLGGFLQRDFIELLGRKMASGLKRREFIKLGGAAAAAGLFPAGFPFSSASEPGKRPNVLFIIVDDLRPEMGCYGSDLVKTPNFDRLARRGLVFSRAYCQQAVCNPSRSSLLTGLRPDTLHVRNNETHFRQRNPDVVTLPQLFKNNGYESLKIGKVFHGTLPDPASWSQPDPPIPVNQVYMSPEIRARQQERAAAAKEIGRSQTWIDAYIRGPATEAFDAPDSSYWDGAAADAAIAAMWKLRKKQPFFLGLGFLRPHLPFVAPKRYWDLYKREDIPLAPNYFLPKGAPRFAINLLTELASYEDFVMAPHPTEGLLSDDQARLLKHGYYACVSFIDAQVGRLLDALDHMKLRQNTIVVLLSDQGFKLGEHGGWGKLTNFECDTRSTLIISAPGQAREAASTSALVELVDVYPTLCELAGLEKPPNLEGVSLVPLFQDPERTWKTAAFSQFQRGYFNRFMGRAIRTERYRYIEWRDRLDRRLVAVELYDHETDPMENVNIAKAPGNEGLVKQLAERLKLGWPAAKPK
jgi:iduronate 2-sulfatase